MDLFAQDTLEHVKLLVNWNHTFIFSQSLFPQYNEMLVGFLQTLELCHRVNLSGVTTNLLTSLLDDVDKCVLFFPSILKLHRPSFLPNQGFSFGWCLCCLDQEHQFFTSRFLHVLLLRLAYNFPLANDTSNEIVTSPFNQIRFLVFFFTLFLVVGVLAVFIGYSLFSKY